uniref:Uncharacterized protein n=1 Tax=Ananas comosus var. bracteatus TaxID=296719 RepID=A0A6V7PY49_ANACO|nr:unnamed protein product [Ananas comosus var. bracteatus]
MATGEWCAAEVVPNLQCSASRGVPMASGARPKLEPRPEKLEYCTSQLRQRKDRIDPHLPRYLNNTPQPFSYLNFPLFFSQPKKQTSEGIVGEVVALVFGLVGDAKVGKPVLEASNLR